MGSMECGVRNTEDDSVGVRTWLQLMCCSLTEEQRLSLILEETSRGDTRGLYCQVGEQQEGTGD